MVSPLLRTCAPTHDRLRLVVLRARRPIVQNHQLVRQICRLLETLSVLHGDVLRVLSRCLRSDRWHVALGAALLDIGHQTLAIGSELTELELGSLCIEFLLADNASEGLAIQIVLCHVVATTGPDRLPQLLRLVQVVGQVLNLPVVHRNLNHVLMRLPGCNRRVGRLRPCLARQIETLVDEDLRGVQTHKLLLLQVVPNVNFELIAVVSCGQLTYVQSAAHVHAGGLFGAVPQLRIRVIDCLCAKV